MLVNTASAISDNNPEGVESTVTTVVQALADLALDVTSTPTVQAGEQVVVTYTVANNGPSTAENVVVTATFPSEVTPPAGWTLVGGNVYIYSVGSVGAGETVVITALVTTATNIEPGTSIQFTGVTGGSTPDADIANNSDNADTSILSTADLALTKTGDPASVAAGELVTYTVVVANNGPSAAQSVDVKDALPLGIGLVSATVVRSGSGPAACGGPVCQVGDMAVGEVITVTVVGRVDASVADGSVLRDTATVFSVSPDPDTSNNTGSAETDVTRSVQLYLRKLAPATIMAGTSLRYTLIVTNGGPSLASNVVVTDVLPVTLTLQSATVNGLPDACSLAGQTLTCRVGTLAPNASAQILIDALAAANAAGPLVNTAQATSAETPEPVDAESVTTVQGRADLKLLKDAMPTTGAGQTIVYTLTVVNLGPSDAQGVVITDSLPPGVTYESSSNCAPAGATVICPAAGSGFTLTAGSNAGFTITVRSDAALPLGVSLENRATVTATTPDTDMSNNTDVADTSIVAEADLSVLKSGPDTLVAGELVTYTILLANAGPSTAHAVDVKDSLPPGIDLVEATVQRTGSDLALCAGAVCQMGDVPPGEAITVTVVGKVKPDLLPGQTLVNTAGVFAGTTDPVNNNNSDTSVGTVTAISSLKVDKTALADQARPDSPLSYNIRVRNDGPSTARDVFVTDDLPAQVIYQGASADCTLNGSGQVICALGDLLPGQTVNFQIYVRVRADVPINAMLRNHVAVTSPTPQDEDAVLEDEVETPVKEPSGPPADLAITKSVQPTLAQAGDVITYTLLITNYGPATALNATVVDFLPLGLELINAAPTQGNCSVGLSCLLGNIAPYDPANPAAGGRARITIIARVLPSAIRGEALHNVAFIQSDNPDPNPANNEDDADVLVGPLASIVIEKATNGKDADLPPGPVIESGKPVTWTYVVTNTGTLTLSEVTVVDSREGAVTCPQTTLAPGASMTCVKTGIASSGQYSNTGTATGKPPTGPSMTDTDDSHYIGDLFTIDIPIIIQNPSVPSIDVEKFTNGDDADIPPGPGLLVGSKVTWTYLVVNNGATRLTDIVVRDNKLGVIRCPKTELASAESMTCIATGTAGPGQYANVAQAIGTSPRGVIVTDVDLSHYFGTAVVPPDGGGLCSDSIIVQYGNYPAREVKLTSAPVAVIGFGAALSARVPFTVTMKDGELATGSYLGWNNDYQAMGRGPTWTLVATGDDKHPKVRWLYTFQVYVIEGGRVVRGVDPLPVRPAGAGRDPGGRHADPRLGRGPGFAHGHGPGRSGAVRPNRRGGGLG